MKKGKKGRKFHRTRAQRKALIASMARSLILRKKIQLTEAKAKELRPFVEKLVTRARKGDVASIRHLKRHLDSQTVGKLVKEVAPTYLKRSGGYTRITKLPIRRGNGAKMAIIEFV